MRLGRTPGCRHLVLLGYRVQPDGGVTDPDLPVDNGAILCAVEATRCESECPDQEVVGCLNILVHQDGNDGSLGDGALLSRHLVPSRPGRRLVET